MRSILSVVPPLVLVCLVAVASCHHDGPTVVEEDLGDPAIIVLDSLAVSYSFDTGTADTAAVVRESSFRISDRVESFHGLYARIAGEWTVGSYETARWIGDFAVRDTMPLFAYARLVLAPEDDSGAEIVFTFNFIAAGRDTFNIACCGYADGSFPNGGTWLGKQMRARLTVFDNLPDRAQPLAGVTGRVDELRLELTYPRLVDPTGGS